MERTTDPSEHLSSSSPATGTAKGDPKGGTTPADPAPAAARQAPLLQAPRPRTIALTISPGRMGLTLRLLPGGGGATVTRIDPSCAFGRSVRVGDVLLSINGRVLNRPEDFGHCRDGPRRIEFRCCGGDGTRLPPPPAASSLAAKVSRGGGGPDGPADPADPALRDAMHKLKFWKADAKDWWKVAPVGSAPVRPTLDQDQWTAEVASALRSLGPDATDLDRQRAGRGMPPGVSGPVREPNAREAFGTLHDAGAGGTDLASRRRRDALLSEILHFNRRANGDDPNVSSARMGAHAYRVLLVPTSRRKKGAAGSMDPAENSRFLRQYNKNSGVFDRFLEAWASYIGGDPNNAADMVLHYMAGRYPSQYARHAAVAEKKVEDARRAGAAVAGGDELPQGFISYDGTKDVKWNTLYGMLVKFREENGHCRVPTKDTVLGNWVTRQRSAKNNPRVKNSHLNDTRVDLVRECLGRFVYHCETSTDSFFVEPSSLFFQLNGIGFVWCGLREGVAKAIPGGDPRMNRTVAAKVAFPDLSLRECMLLGGYDDEELDKVKDQKHTWRTLYVFLKDRVRTKLAKYDTARRTGSRIKIEELADRLRGDDEGRIEAVFGDRASLFAGFMSNADERRREGIDPDAHGKSKSKRKREEEEERPNEDDAGEYRDEQQGKYDGAEPQMGGAEGEDPNKRARLGGDHDQQYEQQETQPDQHSWQPGPYYNMI